MRTRSAVVCLAASVMGVQIVVAQGVSSPMIGGGQVAIAREYDVWRVTVTGPRNGLASLCLADDSTVRILHASAAVGEAVYEKSGDAWVRKSGFTFKLLNTPSGAAPESERRAFFTSMGWLANADNRGAAPREFVIRASEGTRFLGVTFLSTDDPMTVSYWPAGMGDDCREVKVAQGDLPDRASFTPAGWHPLK